MQAELMVTILRNGKNPRIRVTYGPYNTICAPADVFAVKKQLKLLPIICPACKRQNGN